MVITKEIKKKIEQLSPGRLEQFERYVDFLLTELNHHNAPGKGNVGLEVEPKQDDKANER